MKLEKEEYELMQEFMNKLTAKTEKARDTYGMNYLNLTKERTYKEIEEELIDIVGWSCMFWMKLRKEGVIK